MRVLVTGGFGLVGVHLIPRLLELVETQVVIIDNCSTGAVPEALDQLSDDSRLRVVVGDVADAALLDSAVSQADAVVHLAALTSVDRSIEEPSQCITNNVGATTALVQAVTKHQPRRVVAVSTDEVWGSIPAPGLANETTPYRPTNPYAASKAASDHIVAAANHTYGLGITTVWFTTLFGPWQMPGKLISTAVRNRVLGLPVPIYGDGLAVREFTYIDDAVDGLISVLREGAEGDNYIIGSGERLAAIDAAAEVNRIIGGDSHWYTPVAERPGCDQRYAVDTTKVETDLGWEAKIGFHDGIERTATWWRTTGIHLPGGRHHARVADNLATIVAGRGTVTEVTSSAQRPAPALEETPVSNRGDLRG